MSSKPKPQSKDTKARAKSKPAKKKPKKQDEEELDVVNDLPKVKIAAEMSQEQRDSFDKELFEKIVELQVSALAAYPLEKLQIDQSRGNSRGDDA